MKYEKMMMQYPHIYFYEKKMPKGLSGLWYGNVIEIDKYLSYREKNEIMAEEIGHYEKSAGDITDYSCTRSRKQEELARRWAIEKIVSLDELIQCSELKLNSIDDICLYLEITPKYFYKALNHYKTKYGISYNYRGYWFMFDPLVVTKSPK